MSDTDPVTNTVHTNDGTDHDVGEKAPPRKRRRTVISCTECHRRKQKCDRKMPCTNCVSRNKETACRYETGTPLAKPDRKTSSQSGNDRTPETIETIPIKTADFGYSANGVSTLGILRKIEGDGEFLAKMPSESFEGDNVGIRERYKTLVRLLPARTYVDKLADIYFRDVNWQYFTIDEPVFRGLMEKWYTMPFNILSNSGPQALDPMLRAFPALLFQLLASALLYLPEEYEEMFEPLKYTSNMTFDDLALEYSESGINILSLLGKRQMSIITVLAGWVRAAFLKYTGMVTEAWHQVGTSIRDAQEIGLHRDQMDPQISLDDSMEDNLEKIWVAQGRRRAWMNLLGWDLHTGAVLGRPTSVDHRLMNRSLPVDSVIPKDRRKSPIVPRGEDDPPTPLTRAIWAWESMSPLRDILDLEKEGPFPKDFSKVGKIHQDLLDLQARTPPPFRLENPDTRFDNLPECWWLPYARPALLQIMAFNFMALHRPYIFTRPASRNEALKASLDMLEAQRLYFAMLKPQQHKTFSLFFGTFDAIIMIASIYILFPKEHVELLPKVRQHFEWAIERFETMAKRNRLAQAALGVLHAIYVRFKKAVGCGFLMGKGGGDCEVVGGSATTGSAASASDMQTPNSVSVSVVSETSQNLGGGVSNMGGNSSTNNLPTTAEDHQGGSTGLTPASGADTSNMFAGTDWSLPTDFDLSSIMPIFPMGDIAYNELTAVPTNGVGGVGDPIPTTTWGDAFTGATTATVNTMEGGLAGTGMAGLVGGGGEGEEQQPMAWQFGGEFGNDTLWNILNQFPTY